MASFQVSSFSKLNIVVADLAPQPSTLNCAPVASQGRGFRTEPGCGARGKGFQRPSDDAARGRKGAFGGAPGEDVLPRICWKRATISARCRTCWGTKTFRLRKSTRM